MGTPYKYIEERFYSLIEEDRKFFQYYCVDDETAMLIAHERASAYLQEAIDRVEMDCLPSVDFSERVTDEVSGESSFAFDLNASEKLLLSRLMYENYLRRDISYLKTLSVNYTSTDLRVFDPSNARSTFMAMYNTVVEENKALIDTYKNTDRVTGGYKMLTFADYDVTE